MMRFLFIVSAFLVIFSCSKPKVVLNAKNLNGYWEIKQAGTVAEERKKNYTTNRVITYIRLQTDSTAIRRKLSWSFNGSLYPIGTIENLQLKTYRDSIIIVSKTAFSSHKEVVIQLSDSILKLKTSNTIYTYKQYTPIN